MKYQQFNLNYLLFYIAISSIIQYYQNLGYVQFVFNEKNHGSNKTIVKIHFIIHKIFSNLEHIQGDNLQTSNN